MGGGEARGNGVTARTWNGRRGKGGEESKERRDGEGERERERESGGGRERQGREVGRERGRLHTTQILGLPVGEKHHTNWWGGLEVFRGWFPIYPQQELQAIDSQTANPNDQLRLTGLPEK